ncbi:glycosyltransferase [Glaciimonas sp. GG7]
MFINNINISSVLIRKVAIIVTAYNPEINSFRRNIESYAHQVGLVLVCDNSDILEKKKEIESFVDIFGNFFILPMNGNKGIAAAQNYGLDYAINNGYEYFIEIDQDSTLPTDYVEKIIKSYLKLIADNVAVAGIGPLAIRDDGYIYDGHKKQNNVIRVDKTLSSGFFFPKSSFEIVGPKDESLFIDYVDWEWCWRSKKFGLDVFVDTNLEIQHMLGSGHKKFLFLNVGLPAPIRNYYQYRNSFYLFFRRYIPLSWRIKRVVVNIVKLPIYCFFVGDGRLRRIYIYKAFKDVFKNASGKINF